MVQYVSRTTMWHGEPDLGVYEYVGDDINGWLKEIMRESEASPGGEIQGAISAVVFSVEVLLNDPYEVDEFESDYDAELFSSPGDDPSDHQKWKQEIVKHFREAQKYAQVIQESLLTHNFDIKTGEQE